MAFTRSSNWPRYFVPATKAAISSITTRLSNKIRETCLFTIRKASPSTIAVLPTPGSPIRIGLFFFLLLKICETRSISVSLPTIGSKASSAANLVTSLPKLSKTGVFDLIFVFGFDETEGLFGALIISSQPLSSSYDELVG